MTPLYENFWHIGLLAVLLCCSAFFSGSETAFSNLTPRQINDLRKSKHRLHKLAERLLRKPRQLLGCLLFGNMIVNVLFFAATSVLIVRISQKAGTPVAAIGAVVCFSILILFGEILPKSLSYSNSKQVTKIVAGPCFVLVRLLGPVQTLINFLITEPATRLLLGPAKASAPISLSQLKLLIEASRQRGLITADENQLLGEIVEFGWLKVRNVMRPRVDMISCDVKTSAEDAARLMAEEGLTKLAVYSDSIDNIVGVASLRDLLLKPEIELEKHLRKVEFIPEQKTVESLLEYFKKMRTDLAVVVDEYGGIAGSVSLDDIIAELLGQTEGEAGKIAVEQIGPTEYRLAGNLAIHDWAEAFGIEPEESRLSTIAGFTTALLGRIPQQGDVARLKNLKFTVETVRKRRIESVILSVEPDKNKKQEGGQE